MSVRASTISRLVAREGGPLHELTAPERAQWASHFDIYPPLVVAVGKGTAAILAAMGKAPKEIVEAIPWSVMPAAVLAKEPEPSEIVYDEDPRVNAMLKAGAA